MLVLRTISSGALLHPNLRQLPVTMEKDSVGAEGEQESEVAPENGSYRDFEELFSFLSHYHWIHDLQLTRFLASEVWNHIPAEWVRVLSSMSVEELNHFPFQSTAELSADMKTNHDHDDSLTTFRHSASRLSHRHQQAGGTIPPPPIHVGSDLRKGMSPKKLHEVEKMASLVHQMAVESGCSVVVDVGSGLGYLGQVLHKTYGLPVIGLESKEGHSDGAEKRAAKQGLQCSGFRSVPFLITQDPDNVQHFCNLIRDIAAAIQPCQHTPAALGLCDYQHTSSTQPYHRRSVAHGPSSSCCESSSHPCPAEGPRIRASPKKLCSSSCVALPSGEPDYADSLRPCALNPVCGTCLEQEAVRTGLAPGQSLSGHSSVHKGNDAETVLPACQDRESNTCHQEGQGRVSEGHHVTVKDSQPLSCTAKTGTSSEVSSQIPPLEETVGSCACDVSEADVKVCSSESSHRGLEPDATTPVQADLSTQSCRSHFSRREEVLLLDQNELECLGPEKSDPLPVHPSSRSANDGHLSDLQCSSDSTHSEHSILDTVVEERSANRGGGEAISQVDSCDCVRRKAVQDLRVCLIGLHCCGDLTPAMLRLYRAVPFLRALCCVSCCYHKMQLLPGSEHFINFPMSVAASTAYDEVCAHRQSSLSASASPLSSASSVLPATPSASSLSSETTRVFLTPCSLRLAAQETRVRWAAQTEEEHSHHTRHVAYRAVLELFFRDTSQVPPDRKAMRRLDYRTFDHFVQSCLVALNVKKDEQAQAARNRLTELHEEYKQHFQHIEPYTCLQVTMQPVLEWVVLRDRQQWLTEEGLTSDLVPIFDEGISPRNLALVSIKTSLGTRASPCGRREKFE